MKILSKYRDYYDYLVNLYGVDEKIVLNRLDLAKVEHVTSGFAALSGPVVKFGKDVSCHIEATVRYRDDNVWSPQERNILVVAGRLFPLIDLRRRDTKIPPHVLSYEPYRVFDLDKHGDFASGTGPRPTDPENNKKFLPNKYDLDYISPTATKIAREIDRPIFVINRVKGIYNSWRFLGTDVEINGRIPNLQSLGLESFYPAEQLYQDLAYFISNIMRDSPDVQPAAKPPQTNVEKIEAHGFDKKTSFRHRK